MKKIKTRLVKIQNHAIGQEYAIAYRNQILWICFKYPNDFYNKTIELLNKEYFNERIEHCEDDWYCNCKIIK